jgi:hypothetical protein
VERNACSLAVLVSYLVTLPIHNEPIGSFDTYARYVTFVLPAVAAWTISPILLEMERRSRTGAAWAGAAIAGGAAALGAWSFFVFGLHDAYAPFQYVAYMVEHPENRVPYVRRNRAGTAFDVLASPQDTCAFDAGFDTWVYPAYGPGWTRRVEYLRPAEGNVAIPEDADWVAVDRSWNVFFGHPRFVDMGKAFFLGRGRPSDADLRVYRQLSSDPRFELVYDDRSQNQALFRRIHADREARRTP